jgi:DNA-binding NtrC family response regulator
MAQPATALTAATPPAAGSLFERFLAEAAERSSEEDLGLKDFVDLAEAWRIVHALRECRGNRSAAARQLGIGRRTLYTKMEKLGIEETFQISWR